MPRDLHGVILCDPPCSPFIGPVMDLPVVSALDTDVDFVAVISRLRTALTDVSGKLRVDDAIVLAGFDRRTPQRSRLVGHAMRQLGWKRLRPRFAGVLEYAYVRGSILERESILEVVDGEDGQLVV